VRDVRTESVIGKKYERDLLPYGGAVNARGRITKAISAEQHAQKMKQLGLAK